MLPLNTWVRNERLEAALSEAVAVGGVERLRSEYELHCIRQTATDCTDCFSCRTTIQKTTSDFIFPVSTCVKNGQMLIEAEVGPGRVVKSMTYWKR